MDKKEKYINYVVVDMIKNTEIDYDQEKIKSHSSIPSLPLSFLFPFSSPLFSFSKYVIERYGIHDNDVDIIWKLYKERIQSLINNG